MSGPTEVTPSVSAAEIVDAAARLVVGPDREPALNELFSLIRAADLEAVRQSIGSDVLFRWPWEWKILDRYAREIDRLLSTNIFWPFGTAKYQFQFRLLKPALEYFDLGGAEVMELGAGTFAPHILSTYLYLNGARACFAYDPSPIQDQADAARALMALLDDAVLRPDQWHLRLISRADFLARIASFDRGALEVGDVDAACRTTPIRLLSGDLASFSGECRLDHLFSASVLEHIFDLDKFLDDTRALLKPGAVTAHVVDFTDHSFHAGLCEHRWGYLTPGGGDGFGINRVRLSAMLRKFEARGFRTLRVERYTERVPVEVVENLLPEYRDLRYDDLETFMATIVSRCT